MRYTDIYKTDTTNGIGIRVVLWTSGCSHHCYQCHNPQTWSPDNGMPYTEETVAEIISALDKSYIDGITLSGGDPLFDGNLEDIFELVKKIRTELPNKTIWIYSGFTWEQIHDKYSNEQIAQRMELRKNIVELCDVFVDGKFELDKKNIRLKYCGSENQKVIDVQKTLKENKIILFD
jgi:anaerobic ribonucleoside-triphosphate reductase activating protein